MSRHRRTDLVTLPAVRVREGMALVQVGADPVRRRWLGLGPRPVITDAVYRADGEDGRPTVYIQASDRPGWDWPLDPYEPVVIDLKGGVS